ncbi:hypothetical protein CHUAL_000366 [Chamberlinius hualienensis]
MAVQSTGPGYRWSSGRGEEISELGYQHTLMYGRYADLEDYAREEAARARAIERLKWRKAKLTGFKPYKGRCQTKCFWVFGMAWRKTFARIGEEWFYLTLLGVSMALVSFGMDTGINMCQKARLWLYKDLATHVALQYVAWISFPIVLILFSSGFTHVVAPQAIGSGIPELKTILRGVVLKEYLTLRTLISKIIGLTTSLGSGMPLGKEGPFVHISSNMAAVLSKLFTSLGGIYENQGKKQEMLAAACAVGVAACFGAPVGGVLFSIEATTAYFAVRNYWRGFFGAVAGAVVFRLLAVWFTDDVTLTTLYKTSFRLEVPFDPQELVGFALLGAICGVGGAGFVYFHRRYVLWMRKNKKLNYFLQKNRFIYPTIIVLFIASITFPPGFGQFMAAELTNSQQVSQLFCNFTWSTGTPTNDEVKVIKNWINDFTGIFINLPIYVVVLFWTTILASTLPVASGLFIPQFKMGAAFGRLFGEAIAYCFPGGVKFGNNVFPILPGGYAVAGAAAWAGAATHTVSTSVIAFELTGQINHFLPVMISVLISNAVANILQPSIYDSIIKIKKLPYLPDLLPTSSKIYDVYVEDIMVRDVKYIWIGASYRDVDKLLETAPKIKTFPIVESHDSRILIGSIPRRELVRMMLRHFGRERRLQVVAKRMMPGVMELPPPQQTPSTEATAATDGNETVKTERRNSRFEVTPAPDVLRSQDDSSIGVKEPRSSGRFIRSYSEGRPKKSILKKANSIGSYYSPAVSPTATPYSTVTSQDTKLRQAFEVIFRKTQGLRGDKSEPTTPNSTISGVPKKVQLPLERVIDMSPEEQKAWEEEQLELVANFNRCRIDPAPFQLVERTSLLKVHSLFSMLGLNHAYVTAIGRLVGVVALKEIRSCIEGEPPVPQKKQEASSNKQANSTSETKGEGAESDVNYLSTVSSINSEYGVVITDSENEDTFTSTSKL